MKNKKFKRYSFVISDPVLIEHLESKKEPLSGSCCGISEYIRNCILFAFQIENRNIRFLFSDPVLNEHLDLLIKKICGRKK